MAWHYLEQAGVPNVTGVWRGKWPELLRVQIRKSHRGHAQQVAAALWGCHLGNYAGKHLIVVDDDIDIHDWEAIEWALCYRLNAGLGDITTFAGTSGSMLDPSVPLEERDSVKYGHGKWTRVLIDATINWELEPQAVWWKSLSTTRNGNFSSNGGQAQTEVERVWLLTITTTCTQSHRCIYLG
jgi:4-hydroxy-3-polyprenylbenzoate decarboxylase